MKTVLRVKSFHWKFAKFSPVKIVHVMIAFTILQIADQLMTQLVKLEVRTEIALLRNLAEAAQVLVS